MSEHLIELTIRDFLKIQALEVTPDGSPMITLAGPNAAGKSSALKALRWALGGAKHAPERPVRKGATKAEVIIETTNLLISKVQTTSGARLKVSQRDGVPLPKTAQATLNAMVGDLTFDPLAFSRMPEAKQAEILTDLSGLDLGEIEEDRSTLKEEQSEIRRQQRQAKAELEALPDHGLDEFEERNSAELVEELQAAEEINRENQKKRDTLGELRHTARKEVAKVQAIEEQLRLAKRDLDVIRAAGKLAAEEASNLKDVDTEAIREELAGLDEHNAKVRAQARRFQLDQDLKALQYQLDERTIEIKGLDKRKAEALEAVKYPIEGLEVEGRSVLYNGVPLSQASGAETIRISTAIGFALNPELKILLVDEGSALDSKGLELLQGLAAEAGGLVLITRVADGAESVDGEDGSTIYIEDGQEVSQ